MGKRKPLEQFADDVHKGDVILLTAYHQRKEIVGWFQGFHPKDDHHGFKEIAKFNDTSPDNYDNYHHLNLKTRILPGEGKITSYQILKRAKK